ncbi:MAG: hypothetical protein QM642_04060 [Edaphocola sp.]
MTIYGTDHHIAAYCEKNVFWANGEISLVEKGTENAIATHFKTYFVCMMKTGGGNLGCTKLGVQQQGDEQGGNYCVDFGRHPIGI